MKDTFDTKALRAEIEYILYHMNYEGTTLYEEYVSGNIKDEEGYSALDRLVDTVSAFLKVYIIQGPRVPIKDKEIEWINTVRKIVIEKLSEYDDNFGDKTHKFEGNCMRNNLRFKKLKESYDSLEEDINFILFERDWKGTTLYEAYLSGEFDDDKGFDDPLDSVTDTVCAILERDPDVFNVPEFETMEAENRWFRKVRNLVGNALRLGELVQKIQSR